MGSHTIRTDKGAVDICTGFPASEIDGLVFGLETTDPAYQPIYTRKQNLAQIAFSGGSLSLALFRKKRSSDTQSLPPPP